MPAMLNKETGELELDPFQDGTLYHDRETGENSSYPTYAMRRERSKFSIPKQYLRSTAEVLPSSSALRRKPQCCVAKVNASYPLASREKMMHLKEVFVKR